MGVRIGAKRGLVMAQDGLLRYRDWFGALWSKVLGGYEVVVCRGGMGRLSIATTVNNL